MSEPQEKAVPPVATSATANGAAPALPATENNREVNADELHAAVMARYEAAVQRAIEESKRPLPEEMTLSQALDFLDISPLRLYKLIKRGELPCRKVGKRRRIPTAALLEYDEKMFQEARAAAAEITRLSQELDFYETNGPNPLTK